MGRWSGYGGEAAAANQHAWTWTRSGAYTDLGALDDPGNLSNGYAINDRGVVAG